MTDVLFASTWREAMENDIEMKHREHHVFQFF